MLSRAIPIRVPADLWRYPPGRPSQLLTASLLLFTAWAYSAPAGGYVRWTALAHRLWLLLAGYYLLRLAIAAIARRSLRLSYRRGWLVIPVLAAAALILVRTDAPFQARFRLSRGAMDAAAQRVLAKPKQAARIERIGLWPTGTVERFQGGMRFLVDGSGSPDRFGFAYSPSARPPTIGGKDGYSHLDGPWYIWVERAGGPRGQER